MGILNIGGDDKLHLNHLNGTLILLTKCLYPTIEPHLNIIVCQNNFAQQLNLLRVTRLFSCVSQANAYRMSLE